MFRASGYLCHGEGGSTECGGGEMSCSKFVVWGILIITTTTGMLFYNVQHGSKTSEHDIHKIIGYARGTYAAL